MKWFLFIFFILVGGYLLVPRPPLLDEIEFSKVICDEEHHLLRFTLTSDEKYRLFTPLNQISPLLVQTTLLQEDQYFFEHFGFNPVAVVKGAWFTYVLRTRPFGSSTISMQVVRLRDKMNTKNIPGKIWQILKAIQLELSYSKKEILEAYLNLASYGGNIEGIGAASLIYYQKSASQLNFIEAMRLSVVPQNPNRRRPDAKNQENLQKATAKLFQRWLKHHPEDQEKENLIEIASQPAKRNLPFLAPHFVDKLVRSQEQNVIVTTLNLTLQTLIEKVTRQYLEKQKKYKIKNAAALLVDTRNMEVKALLGSGNYFDSTIHGQINGTNIKRSPGSTLKPFIYALAMEQGLIHPYTVLKDAPMSFGEYNPENFDKDFLGPIKAKDALILSRNVPALFLAQQLIDPSLYEFLQQAHVSQLQSEDIYGLSLVLGGAEVTMEELVTLYAMLANQGVWQPLRFQKEHPFIPGERLLSREVSFLTLDMLRETTPPHATNVALDHQLPVYWKTGTSSGYRDAWSVGIFGPYVLAVWLGDFDYQSHARFIGSEVAAPLFFNMIEAISAHVHPLSDVVEEISTLNLTQVEVCEASGLLPNPHCPHTVKTWFIPGKSPIKTDQVHREIAIDHKTNLRTRHIDQETQFAVYEFWPSDLMKIFAEAGVQRKLPPPFDSEDAMIADTEGNPPQIISPQQNLCYTLRLNDSNRTILFSASAEGDVRTLYWFVNREFIGSGAYEQSFAWQAKPGTYLVRVVDDHGRTAVRELVVKSVE